MFGDISVDPVFIPAKNFLNFSMDVTHLSTEVPAFVVAVGSGRIAMVHPDSPVGRCSAKGLFAVNPVLFAGMLCG